MKQTCSQGYQKTKNIFTEIPNNTLNKQTTFYGEEKNKSEVVATVKILPLDIGDQQSS